MSAASNPALSQPEGFGKRLRHLAVGALFALVLLIPESVHVRGNPRSWMLFRIFWGVAGGALVVLPLGLRAGFVPAIVGLAMFISSILLPPAKPDTSSDEKARELGALVVVNGGAYRPSKCSSAAGPPFFRRRRHFRLFPRLPPLPVIPVSRIPRRPNAG